VLAAGRIWTAQPAAAGPAHGLGRPDTSYTSTRRLRMVHNGLAGRLAQQLSQQRQICVGQSGAAPRMNAPAQPKRQRAAAAPRRWPPGRARPGARRAPTWAAHALQHAGERSEAGRAGGAPGGRRSGRRRRARSRVLAQTAQQVHGGDRGRRRPRARAPRVAGASPDNGGGSACSERRAVPLMLRHAVQQLRGGGARQRPSGERAQAVRVAGGGGRRAQRGGGGILACLGRVAYANM